MQDLRLAVRALRATPVVTLVAIASLALGIGANTAIFSIIDSLLLRSLPVERPDQLVGLSSSTIGERWWPNPLWESIRERRRDLFDEAFAFAPTRFNLAAGGQTDIVEGLWVSGEYFDALGVSPLLGRAIASDDDRRGGGPNGPAAVISYSFWQRRFGGAVDVVGRTQTIERVSFTIIGVMPPGFFGTNVGSQFDVAIPLGTEPLLRGPESYLDRGTTSFLRIMARLKDGQTLAAAEQAIRGVQPQLREDAIARAVASPPRPESRAQYLAEPFTLIAAAGGTSQMRGRYRQAIFTIMTVVAFVLVIACANLANLLLARATARRHELSVRMALGASRWQLARQLLVESALLSAAGAIAGLVLAQWGSWLLVRQWSTPSTTVFLDVGIDWRMLTFTVIVASAAALLFGLVPALRASRADPIEAMRDSGRGIAGERTLGFGHLLVAGQVALSLVLVVGAGLFVRTFASLTTRDVGFERDGVVIARLSLTGTGVEPARRAEVYERMAAALREVPGVAQSTLSDVTPISGTLLDIYVEIEHVPLAKPMNISYINTVTPGWFATYGTRLIGGRDFDDRDRAGAPPVVIVNETFVRKYLGGDAAHGPPIGRRIRNYQPASSEQHQWMEIVGVAADAAYVSMRNDVPATMYLPMAQARGVGPGMSAGVRAASGAPMLLARAIAEAIGRVNPDVAITFTPLTQQVGAALVQERTVAMLSGFFGALALLLAGLGLYGVTAYAVSRRRGEIGIRMALGAEPAGVIRLVLVRVAILVGLGVVAGLGISLWASRFVAPLLYGLTPRDPFTLATSTAVLVIVGLAAGWIPARRASRIDPATVLRQS